MKEFKFQSNERDENIPYNGIGKLLLQRKFLVREKIDQIINENIPSVYFRAPPGSGKSVLLQLFGKELQARSYPVFIIEHAGYLKYLDDSDFEELDKRYPDQKIFLLIDEVHHAMGYAQWNYLLKKKTNIVSIGMGIPELVGISPSPQFIRRKNPDELLLTSRDIDKDTVEFFMQLLNSSDKALVENMLQSILSYTSGHAYPFLKMAEYCCLARGDDCSKGLVEEIISGKEFFNSKWYEKIVDRSLVWDNIMLESCITILSTGITSFTSAKELFQLGYWNKRKEWFISNFFISFIFNNYQIEKIPSIEDDSLSIEDIISIGLKYLHETNFYMRQKLENGHYVLRHEDFISWYFGNQLAMMIRGIYISPQSITIPNVMSETKSPAIKYFINGKHIQQLELVVVRNSDRLETHFENFVGKDGVNKSNRAWAIVDILSDRTSQVLQSNTKLPLSHKYENHLYSFTKPNNTLWKGRVAIKKNVSVNFRAQAFSTLTHFKFINSQILRQFSQIGKWFDCIYSAVLRVLMILLARKI